MNNEDIINEILNGNSIVIVGPSDSGKTFWIKNTLIPKLKELSKSAMYSKDGFNKINSADIAIFDEAETLFDADILQEKYPESNPYYSEKYIKQVNDWHKMYASHPEQSIYVISRKEGDVQFLLDHFNKSDWDNRSLKVLRFLLE